jgi:glutamate-ammonia-ligase adenylyltransferase
MGETGLVPEGVRLAQIHEIYSTILQVMSAALVDPKSDAPWGGAFKDLLAQLTHYPDFGRLQVDIKAMQAAVSAAAAAWYEKAKGL